MTSSKSAKYLAKLVVAATLSAGSSFSPNSSTASILDKKVPCAYTYASEMFEKPLNTVNIRTVEHKINSSRIPILMLHKIGVPEDRYTISPKDFRRILGMLHDNNYYLLNLEKFTSGDFSGIPTGKKPILLTFDDAGEGQFYMKKDSVPDSDCAVGILNHYEKEYPEFGHGAVFFISYSNDKHEFREPFLEKGKSEEKLRYLFDNGYDLGYHTPFHSDNTNATKNDIDEQSMILDALFFKSLGPENYEKLEKAYAHPFGAKPKDNEVYDYLCSEYKLVFDAWGGESRLPGSKNFNPEKIPRIETHMDNIESVIHNKSNYKISRQDSLYYKLMFHPDTDIRPRGLEENPNWNAFLDFKMQTGEM